MSYLFVDRILEQNAGQQSVGLKYVTTADHYLIKGRQGRPALTPPVVGEALGQLAAWNVMHACDYRLRPVAGICGHVYIDDDVYVGEALRLSATIRHWDEQAVRYHAVATVDKRIILRLEGAIGPMLPLTDFNAPDALRQRFQDIYQPGDDAGEDTGLLEDAKAAVPIHPDCLYDDIVEWQPGKFLVARKRLNPTAAYFVEHFPHKPVLPLTMLLHANQQLIEQFIYEGEPSLAGDSAFVPSRLRRIKMSDFVLPDALLTTRIQIKQREEEMMCFSVIGEVNGKRVFSCESECVRYEV